MFKPVYGINGYLTLAMNAGDTTATIDESTACIINRVLQVGDWTYLVITSIVGFEVIKVTAITGYTITVVRAQDGTAALNWPVDTSVSFEFVASAITDIINANNLGTFVLKGEGIVTVTQTGVNEYTISAPEITMTSTSDKILVGGEFPNFVISSPLVSDCCG